MLSGPMRWRWTPEEIHNFSGQHHRELICVQSQFSMRLNKLDMCMSVELRKIESGLEDKG